MDQDAGKLRVGCWPGESFSDNMFIPEFCEALRDQGVDVVDLSSPRDPRAGSVDIVQMHWLEQAYWKGGSRAKQALRMAAYVLALRRLRRSGVLVSWMVHNLKPHDMTKWQGLSWPVYAWAMSRFVDGLVSLSPATLPGIRRRFGRRNQAADWIRHPIFPARAGLPSRAEARAEWAVPEADTVLAFVGSVRGYKGVDDLVDVASSFHRDELTLVVGGRTSETHRVALEARMRDCPNIDARLRRLSDEEFSGVVRACDWVVLPFRDTLHSSSIVHALSLGRPVLTPSTPFSEDLAKVVGRQWVRTYRGRLGRADIQALPPPPVGSPRLDTLSREEAGVRLVAFYGRLMTRTADN